MIDTGIHVVCSHCSSVNRVPELRLLDKPICGKCKLALLAELPVELNDANFQKFISRTSLPIIVDFWAPWCMPCRMMAPEFAEATPLVLPGVILAHLNIDEAKQTAVHFRVTGVPCLIAFKNGAEIERKTGTMNKPQIIDWANSIS